MEFMLMKDIPQEAYYEDRVLYPVRATNPVVSELFINLNKVKEEDLITLLNKINNQGITSIDTVHMVYTWKEKQLNFKDLSTAERVFLAAKAADIAGRKVYFTHELMQLTRTTFKKFVNEFKDSSFIVLAFDSEINLNFYKHLVGGN